MYTHNDITFMSEDDATFVEKVYGYGFTKVSVHKRDSMKRRNELATIVDATNEMENEPTPVRLEADDLKPMLVTIKGKYTFVNTGHSLACPQCGMISGVGIQKLLDETFVWFLRFGCEHYEEEVSTGGALNPEGTVITE